MILDTSERASEQIEGTSGDMYREKCCSELALMNTIITIRQSSPKIRFI